MNMNRRLKYVSLLVVTLILVGAWASRYVSLNNYYKSLSDNTREVYDINVIVPLEDDYINKGMKADGYSIRVDGFEIVEYESYVKSLSTDIPTAALTPEKLGLVYITLYNAESDAPGIMLTELKLHGMDNYVGMNWDVLAAANPVLANGYGISLSPNTEYSIVLPFDLFEMYFGSDTWRNLEAYEFFLHVTAFPTEKDIRVR